MKNYTLLIFSLLVLMQICANAQSGNNAKWTKTFSKNEGIEDVVMSANAKYAILVLNMQLNCVNTEDGKVLWSKKFKEHHPHKGTVVTWVDSITVIVPTSSSIEWVDATTGKILSTIPLNEESLENILQTKRNSEKGYIKIEPIRFGYVLFLPFEDMFCLIDMIDRKIIYTSNLEPANILAEFWGDNVLLYGPELDEAIVFSSMKRKVLYKQSSDLSFEVDLYQHLTQYAGDLALITTDDLVCVDVESGKLLGAVELPVSDMENYSAVLINGKLNLLVQIDDEIRLYDVRNAKVAWVLNGIGNLMNAYSIEKNQLVVFVNQDDLVSAVCIDAAAGKVKWKRELCELDGSYTPGIKHYIAFGYSAKNYPRGWGNSVLDSINVHTYHSEQGHDTTSGYTDEMKIEAFSDYSIRSSEMSDVQVHFIKNNSDNIIVAVIGDCSALGSNTDENEKNGEGVFVLSKTTGEIKQQTKVPFYRDFVGLGIGSASIKYAGRRNKVIRYDWGAAVIGSHTLAIVDTVGNVDTVGFHSERSRVFDIGKDYVALATEHTEDEMFANWKIGVGSRSLQSSLISLSDITNSFSTRGDTTLHDVTVVYNAEHNKLYGYEKLSEIPKKWPTPKWTVSDEQLEKAELGTLFPKSGLRVSGINNDQKQTFLFGEDGLGIVDNTTGCFKKVSWEAEYDYNTENMRKFINVGDYVVFLMPHDAGILKVDNCNVKSIGRATEQFAENGETVLISRKHFRIFMFLNVQTNRVDLYKL